MDTATFFSTILPEAGLKIIALFGPYTKDGVTRMGWSYKKFGSHASAATYVSGVTDADVTIYHACSSFGDWYVASDGKRRIRTQGNVVACRSLYDDIDVSGNLKKDVYRTLKDASAAAVAIARALVIKPFIVGSGGGLHVYFPLSHDVTPEVWLRLSAKKRAITTHLGLKIDRAVDMDSARVLRPIGTSNMKTGTPRPVTLQMEGKPVTAEVMEAKLDAYMSAHGLTVATDRPTPAARTTDSAFAWANDTQFPPSSALEIVKHCTTLRSVADGKGDCEEPLWRAMLALVKHTVEGDALAHEWSTGYAHYDALETQAKIDAWVMPPPTCEHFDSLTNCAKTCAYRGRQKSPINLGYAEITPLQVEMQPTVDGPTVSAPFTQIGNRKLYHFPARYSWNGSELCKAVRNGEGIVELVPFCRSAMYPITRVRGEDGIWSFRCASLEANGRWKEFTIPTQDTSSGDTLAKALAQYEVFLSPGKNSRTYIMTYLHDYLGSLQAADVSVRTYARFGWADDYSSFVLGNRRLFEGKEEEILCTDHIPRDLQDAFREKGTAEQWAEDIDHLVNRPGAEVHQYAMCHGFGAVLTELMCDKGWHGIPMALIGPGGQGKSTIAELAAGAFGNSEAMLVQGGNTGATNLGVLNMVEVMNGLPLLLDEMSGRSPEELRDIAYAIVNGRRKITSTPGGKLRSSSAAWFGNPFMTSNESVYQLLGLLPESDIASATQLRIFEFPIQEGYIDQVFPDLDRDAVKRHQREQYGVAGRQFIHFVMRNRVWVTEQLIKARAKLNPQGGDENAERFYRDDLVTSITAGKIAQRLGLLKFDMKHLQRWVLDHIVSLRSNRAALKTNMSDLVAQFISDLHGRMIITQEIRDGRHATLEEPLEQLRGPAVGRISIKDKRVIVQIKALNDWAKLKKIPIAALRDEMDRIGLLIHGVPGEPLGFKFYIGRGANVLSSQAFCYELNYRMMMGQGAVELVRPRVDAELRGTA